MLKAMKWVGWLPLVVAILITWGWSCGGGEADSGAKLDGGAADAGIDGSQDAGQDGDAATPACDLADHTGCEGDQLCCDVGGEATCRSTNTSECSACGTACEPLASDGCTDRECRCGSLVSCGDPAPLCDVTSGTCVECLSFNDCAGEQCLAGACVECNPADNAGCTADTPICSATTLTCEACTPSPDNCPAPLVCTVSGECAGCDPVTHAGCDSPTAPVCDDSTVICRGCLDGGECLAALSLDYCLGDGRCAECDPADDSGCSDTTPICRTDMTGQPTCAECLADTECAAYIGTTVCAQSGGNLGACVECDAGNATACLGPTPYCEPAINLCVECVTNAECGGATPICEPNICRACASDSECAAMSGTTVCAEAGVNLGACVVCDAANDSACVAPTPACDTTTNGCVECTSWQHCSGNTPICDENTCRGCAGDDECALINPGSMCGGSGACG